MFSSSDVSFAHAKRNWQQPTSYWNDYPGPGVVATAFQPSKKVAQLKAAHWLIISSPPSQLKKERNCPVPTCLIKLPLSRNASDTIWCPHIDGLKNIPIPLWKCNTQCVSARHNRLALFQTIIAVTIFDCKVAEHCGKLCQPFLPQHRMEPQCRHIAKFKRIRSPCSLFGMGVRKVGQPLALAHVEYILVVTRMGFCPPETKTHCTITLSQTVNVTPIVGISKSLSYTASKDNFPPHFKNGVRISRDGEMAFADFDSKQHSLQFSFGGAPPRVNARCSKILWAVLIDNSMPQGTRAKVVIVNHRAIGPNKRFLQHTPVTRCRPILIVLHISKIWYPRSNIHSKMWYLACNIQCVLPNMKYL